MLARDNTKKKELNPKMKMGTNSFGVHIVKPKKYPITVT